MEFADNHITITDTNIITFYKENPHMNFLSMNYLLIEIIKTLTTTDSRSFVHDKIMPSLAGIQSDIDKLKSDMTIKLMEHKKEYVDEFKSLMKNNTTMNEDRVAQLIDKNTEFVLMKSKQIADSLPKNYEQHIATLSTTIASKFDKLSESAVLTANSQFKMGTDLSEFLNKYKNNSYSKGEISELELLNTLQSIYPNDDITSVANETSTCDILMKRLDANKPTILFENKCYTTQVSSQEVKKFEFDIQKQQQHGIFISQNSSIALKPDFHIDVINGFIHIYISNVNYDKDKIKLAVNVLDHLSPQVAEFYINHEGSYTITTNEINELTEQYKQFETNKSLMVDNLNKFIKQFIATINALELPSVRQILSRNNLLVNTQFKCRYCSFVGKNIYSKTSHENKCKKKHELTHTEEPVEI
jgi:hypothetical protein